MQAELILDARCGTGESPVWSAHEQALYWFRLAQKNGDKDAAGRIQAIEKAKQSIRIGS